MEDFFRLELPGKPTDTVSLWILTRTDSIPKKDAFFTLDGLEVEISEASPRRIGRVTIRRPQPAATENPEPERPGRVGRDGRVPNPRRP